MTGQGLLVGRDPTCDITVADPSISRRHALIRTTSEGVELVPLGRTPVLHNGKPCERAELLVDGDKVGIGEFELVARIELPPPGTVAKFRIVRNGKASYAISQTPFVIGGSDADDLILDGRPPSGLRLHLAQGELFVEATSAATKNGEAVEPDTLEPIAVGDVVAYFGDTFEIARGDDRAHTTIVGDVNALPSKVVVEMLPRGGRIVFSMPNGDHTVYLADRRLDLIAALVRPPSGYAPGDFIPDEVLRPMVWPRNPNVIRSEINVHITRCRKDLLGAGLAGPRLLQRSPGGGATRLALAPGCTVEFL